ncbi:MAG: tRNA (adenosine(37)-N6)-threonylcarbamoyltransferase complex transferase subunit TsaD, partial [Candidatus Kerfeldbacteria bacterium]|nr:tRNA (adenosine(37)-N6)-threonylcarbamoyltransferase complex transferase subunit TsaD [Candidatus Kerfeldbacteria bacterium]
LVGVNHLEGHLAASLLNRRLRFPIVGLIVSGGHTELVLMHGYGRYDHIGRTRDDAAGEAFDKVAILLDLSYPGGPVIAKLAAEGNARGVALPRPMLDHPNFDFSFSGLKTAVRNYVAGHRITAQERADLAASFQAAVCDVLVAKTIRAARKYRAAGVTLCGGVSANLRLRRQLAASLRRDVPRAAYYQPPLLLTGDNATMIAAAGYQKFRRHETTPWSKLTASPTLTLTTSPRG